MPWVREGEVGADGGLAASEPWSIPAPVYNAGGGVFVPFPAGDVAVRLDGKTVIVERRALDGTWITIQSKTAPRSSPLLRVVENADLTVDVFVGTSKVVTGLVIPVV